MLNRGRQEKIDRIGRRFSHWVHLSRRRIFIDHVGAHPVRQPSIVHSRGATAQAVGPA
jgi:hypothetical protein